MTDEDPYADHRQLLGCLDRSMRFGDLWPQGRAAQIEAFYLAVQL
jgi:hypothetical protein